MKVSVLMCVHNEREEYLKDSIRSILTQTLTDFELLICIDGPWQENLRTVNYFCDKRIKLFVNKKSMGLTKSLNKLWGKAKGKYIARLDSHDLSHPTRLEKQYNYMQKHKDIYVLGCRPRFINKKGKHILRLTTPNFIIPWMVKLAHKFTNQFIHSALFIRNRQGLRYLEYYYYCQDYELTSRLLSPKCHNHKGNNLFQKLVSYRIHENNKKSSQDRYTKLIKETY